MNNSGIKKMNQCYEDYLEKLLALNNENGVRNVDLAEQMGVSKVSVHKAMALLRQQGYIEQEHYGVIRLTVKGKKYGEMVKSRHNVIKGFLLSLGIEEDIAEEDACKMEHCISMQTYEKLKALLNK